MLKRAECLRSFFVVLVLLSQVGSAHAQDLELQVELNQRGVPQIRFSAPIPSKGDKIWRVTLLRSTSNLSQDYNKSSTPIALIPQELGSLSFTDVQAPEDVTLYYQVKVDTAQNQKLLSNVVSIRCPQCPIKDLLEPNLVIDKLRYALLVYDGDRFLRSLPIALGSHASARKLHFDRASTPEGIYRVYAMQPQATFYRALDIDYPNLCDKVRLKFHEASGLVSSPAPHIGGEIQIHGQGIYRNWTWGCIALRDSDMDWLFSRPELRVGLPVSIAGSELKPEDLLFLRSLTSRDKDTFREKLREQGYDPGASEEDFIWTICQFQLDNSMVVSGLLDSATVTRLGAKR